LGSLCLSFHERPIPKNGPCLGRGCKGLRAGMFQTMKTVTLPLALPGILYALSILFVINLGTFAVPAMLGLPVGISVLGTEIREAISRYPGDYNFASALSMVTLGMCIVMVMIQRRLILPREFITVTGRGYRPV